MSLSRRNLDLWEDKNLFNCRYVYLSDKYHITPERCRQIYLKVQRRFEIYLHKEDNSEPMYRRKFTMLEVEYFNRAIACRKDDETCIE